MSSKKYSEQAPNIDVLKALEGYLLLEFGTDWCGHCQAAQAAIEAVVARHKLQHIKVLDGKGKKLGRIYGVKLWPTLILLQSGEELARVVRPVEIDEVEALCTHTLA